VCLNVTCLVKYYSLFYQLLCRDTTVDFFRCLCGSFFSQIYLTNFWISNALSYLLPVSFQLEFDTHRVVYIFSGFYLRYILTNPDVEDKPILCDVRGADSSVDKDSGLIIHNVM